MNVRGREGNCARIENAVTFHLQGDRPGNKKKKKYIECCRKDKAKEVAAPVPPASM